MNDDIRRTLDSLLRPDERVLWEGMPVPGMHLSSEDAVLIPFSIVWCGFAIFWTTMSTRMGAPGFFSLFGCFFVLIGLYFVFGRFIHSSIRAKSTGYAVTNQRVIFIERGNVNSIPMNQIPSLEIRARNNDMGTIYFAPQVYYRSHGDTRRAHRPSFRNIPEPYEVYRIIEAQMSASGNHGMR